MDPAQLFVSQQMQKKKPQGHIISYREENVR